MIYLEQQAVVISADELMARGFPPVEISFDTTDTWLSGGIHPDGDLLVSLGGPPGEIAQITLNLVRATAGEALPALDALAKANDLPDHKFKLGRSTTFKIAGAVQRAQLWSNQVMYRVTYASILIPLPHDREAVLVTFAAECNIGGVLTPSSSHKPVVESLKIVPKY